MSFETISAASKKLGYRSRSTIYDWIQKGQLDSFLYVNPKGRKFLKMEGLKEYLIANKLRF